ncbi:zeta toxin family protein [Alteribacillus bidgolensis]|uniref:UDP-N-acetylglucosamine kinase n=1 Tax=Alteribacillus bidgolensis TaxID=930129 RepID=A0A1G8RB74_9BACI|nr:zeta toxin family protein [Alteribacillus bidgolensis]SDJ14208.1 Zeta toxin [Alteribacillus bidgolensis]
MRSAKLPPMMYIFAGNNGSGKSTLRNLLIDKLGIDINIDPDSIARRLNPQAPETKQFAAGKAAVKLVYECIEEEKSFSIETTLAGKNAIHQMIKAKERGFEVLFIYEENLLCHIESMEFPRPIVLLNKGNRLDH